MSQTTSQQKSEKCSWRAADLREKRGTAANSPQSSGIEHDRPMRRIRGKRTPESAASSFKSSKRPRTQSDMNVSCENTDKGIDKGVRLKTHPCEAMGTSASTSTTRLSGRFVPIAI